jgi:hypothetical protein
MQSINTTVITGTYCSLASILVFVIESTTNKKEVDFSEQLQNGGFYNGCITKPICSFPTNMINTFHNMTRHYICITFILYHLALKKDPCMTHIWSYLTTVLWRSHCINHCYVAAPIFSLFIFNIFLNQIRGPLIFQVNFLQGAALCSFGTFISSGEGEW